MGKCRKARPEPDLSDRCLHKDGQTTNIGLNRNVAQRDLDPDPRDETYEAASGRVIRQARQGFRPSRQDAIASSHGAGHWTLVHKEASGTSWDRRGSEVLKVRGNG